MTGKMICNLELRPLISQTDSDSILCTSFELCVEKETSTFYEHIDLQSQAIYDEKSIPRKVYIL